MEQTFFRSRPRPSDRNLGSKADEVNREELKPGEPAPTDADGDTYGLPIAQVHTMAFRRHEAATSHQLDLDTAGQAAASFQMRVGETPQAFQHLYASLERIVTRVADVSIVTGSLVGTDRPYVLGVTSALGGEGKTTTALHMALTVARSTPKRVCLIDLGLGAGELSGRLGMPESDAGLVAAVEDGVEVVPCFNLAECDNLVVVPAGRAPANPAKFAREAHIGRFLAAMRHSFDMIIVDLPAVSTENVLPLCRHLDGVLMVVRAGVTPREVVNDAVETLGADRVKCVVLNRTKPSTPKWLQKRFARV